VRGLRPERGGGGFSKNTQNLRAIWYNSNSGKKRLEFGLNVINHLFMSFYVVLFGKKTNARLLNRGPVLFSITFF
jgi:hypothetical protein